jgi:hypothetical protein
VLTARPIRVFLAKTRFDLRPDKDSRVT